MNQIALSREPTVNQGLPFRWLSESPLYRENFEIAEAMRRGNFLATGQEFALDGIEQPIISQGQPD